MKKILTYNNLEEKIKLLKKKGEKIAHCHGVFDVVHIGHIKHFLKAKKSCDILIVTVTSDKYVKKGSNRPIFNQEKRLEFLSNLECIDLVCLSDFETAINVIKKIKPDIYVKGKDYKSNDDDNTGNIRLEKKIVISNGGKILITEEETFSSSNIINNNFSYDKNQIKFLNNITKQFSNRFILDIFKKINKLNVLVLGETIIDQYNFCEALGKSGKEPYLALKNISSENYLGGAAAIANHIVDFVNSVKLVSMIGENKEFKKFIDDKLNNKIKTFYINKKNSPTIVKKRFIEHINKTKLFGIYSLNDELLNEHQNFQLKKFLKKEIKNYDLIIVSDYGHGFISEEISKVLTNSKKFISLNAQVNASNIGYHTLQKYKKINTTIINETELRHEMRSKNEEIKSLSLKLLQRIQTENLIVTRGKNGAILLNKKNNIFIDCPAFANNIVDKVGAGDAMLSILSLLLKVKSPHELSILLGSFAGVFSVETIGNSVPINKKLFLRYLEFALK